MCQENPMVTPDHVDRMVAEITADGKWFDQLHLARTGGLYFDHHGDPPRDADAIVLENEAFEYRKAAAKYDIDGVTDRIQLYAARIGVEVEPGSIDERILGSALLNEWARSSEESAAQLRKLNEWPANAENNTVPVITALYRLLEVATERFANIGSVGEPWQSSLPSSPALQPSLIPTTRRLRTFRLGTPTTNSITMPGFSTR
jgi:hypothetical protein